MTGENAVDDCGCAPGDEIPGFLFACVLDGEGGGEAVDSLEASRHFCGDNPQTVWIHVDRTAPGIEEWIEKWLRVSEETLELLMSHDTRPLCFREDDALITILRGLNLNDGAAHEDMIALQIHARETRIVTLRRRHLQSPRDVLAHLTDTKDGPETAGDLIADLAETLVKKMSRAIMGTNNRLDQCEDASAVRDDEILITEIATIRRKCLALQRYMSPQHEALTELLKYAPAWVTEQNKHELRRTSERLDRYLSDLEVSKESAVVLQDELMHRADAEMNRTMYMLSIIAAIFLPLSFVTGLLGVNVGGIPGVDEGSAFWITVGALTLLTALEFYIFRKLKWL